MITKIVWTDGTSYSQGEPYNDRVPRVLETLSVGFKVAVHKHIHYGEKWLLTCHSLNINNEMLGLFDDVEDAQKAGLSLVLIKLSEKIRVLTIAAELIEEGNK